MSKSRTVYICQSCGRHAARMMGRCPGCGEWGTLVETVQEEQVSPGTRRRSASLARSQPQRLNEISTDGLDRLPLPIEEFSRVLGGGIVPGSLILVSGDPGIGKSTLLLQVAAVLAESAGPVLYVSGEESSRQIKMRAERLGIKAGEIYLVTETELETILDHLHNVSPRLLVVDSIQTTYTSSLESAAGNISQIRACAGRLQDVAKATRGRHVPGGTRHQGGHHRRTAGAGAHRGHGALSGGGSLSRLPAAASHQESLWRHLGGGRL